MSRGVRRRAAIGTLALTLAASAMALLVAEGVARWRLPAPRYHDAPLQLDAELGFRGIPGYREDVSDEQGKFVFELNAGGIDHFLCIPNDVGRGVVTVEPIQILHRP